MSAQTVTKDADSIVKTPANKGGNAAPWFLDIDAAAMATKARDELAKADKAQRRGLAYWFRAVALLTYQDAANLYRHDGTNTLGVHNIASFDLGQLKAGKGSGRIPSVFSLWMERLCDVLIAYPMRGKERIADRDYTEEQRKYVATQRTNISNAARMFIDLENSNGKPGTEASLKAWDEKQGLLTLAAPMYAPYGYHINKEVHGENIPMDGRVVHLKRVLVGDERNNDSNRAISCMVYAQSSWVREASLSRSKKRIYIPVDDKKVGGGVLQPTQDDDIKRIQGEPAKVNDAAASVPAAATTTTATVTTTTAPTVSAALATDNTTVRAPHSDSDTVQSIGFDKLVLELAAILDRRLTEAGSAPVLPEHFSPKVWQALQSIASEVQAIENNALNVKPAISTEARGRKPGRDKAA